MCKLRCCPVRDGFKVGRPIHRRCKLDEPRARLEGVWLGGGAAVMAAQRMTRGSLPPPPLARRVSEYHTTCTTMGKATATRGRKGSGLASPARGQVFPTRVGVNRLEILRERLMQEKVT